MFPSMLTDAPLAFTKQRSLKGMQSTSLNKRIKYWIPNPIIKFHDGKHMINEPECVIIQRSQQSIISVVAL
jgi:hypothetical protein